MFDPQIAASIKGESLEEKESSEEDNYMELYV